MAAMTLDDVLALLRALATRDVDYILVGGIAIGLHGFERATKDIDLFVRPDEQNVARLRAALRDVYEDDAIDEIRCEDLAGDYPTIRYGPPTGDFVIDIFSRLGEAIRFEDLEFQMLEVEGIPVRLATPATLFKMKKDTVRSIDRIDARNLAERFGLRDED